VKRSSFTAGSGWFYILLAITVVVMYAPSMRFGLIWDDPVYYQRGQAQSSLWQILTSLQPPTYQFYRPAAVLYMRLIVSPEGAVNAPLAHLLQIAMHLVATLAAVPVLRALGFGLGHARLASLCCAIFPLSYQAVAWQQNQQPLMFMWILLSALAAVQYLKRKSIAYLVLSLVAYALALLSQEGSLLFVFIFFWLALGDGPITLRRLSGWPLLHLGLAVAYALIWLSMPRQSSVTGRGFQPMVLAYLLQGIGFPVSHGLAGWIADWPLAGWMALFAAVGLVLALGVWIWTSARSAALCCAWITVGLAPIWAGLSWDYVQLGPRLLYPASLGIAGLWGGWAAWAFSADQARWRRGWGALTLIAVLLVSFQQWRQFTMLYQVGTDHMARAVKLLSAQPGARLLFVNFPDRIELRPRPYPMGYWGIVLAPVVQNLSDYAHAEVGRSGIDRSAASFQVGADERGAWLYRVDMRGEDKGPAVLFQAALDADAVYLTRYRPDGTLDLQMVGSVRPAQSTHTLAVMGDSVQLAEAGADVSGSRLLTLELTWRCLGPLKEHDTILVHFWKDGAFLGDADGDSLGGLVPLAAWKTGAEILDVRQVDISTWGAGRYEVKVGIYNRVDGKRYPARSPAGSRFQEDEVLVYAFTQR
jgi:hypothetical protein